MRQTYVYVYVGILKNYTPKVPLSQGFIRVCVGC